MTVLHSETVDGCESPGEVLLLAVGSGGKAVDHDGELLVGKWSVVDDSAVG
jgi:hypothetical protein